MNPYNTTLMPPLFNDESYFNYALRSHVKFSVVVLCLLLLLLILLWNWQPWFEIEIKRIATTQGTDGRNFNKALQSKVELVDYLVRPGDTLSEIAERYGIRMSVLMKHNGIDNSNTIRSGQRLKIPLRRTG